MNPSAFVNQQPANPYALPLPNGAANPGASGSAGPGLNGTPAAGSGGASPAGVANGDVKMEEAGEGEVGEGKEVEGGEGENGEGGPSKREQEREEHDLDLADLLDKMDDWKSVVSQPNTMTQSAVAVPTLCPAQTSHTVQSPVFARPRPNADHHVSCPLDSRRGYGVLLAKVWVRDE